MKVSGFTFVKNAVKYGYPVVESIQSILPFVDEMIVCLGDSEDETNQLIEAIDSEKIKLIHSVWDKTITKGGKVLAVETDKALKATATDADWLFYIQADEVVHEKYHATILKEMEKYLTNKKVEGLLFNYHHFYGSYKYIGDGRRWYSKEIRVIRNDKNISSYLDAQGFRWNNNRKLNVKLIDAWIYHYGWVRNPITMLKKWIDFGVHWFGDQKPGEKDKGIKEKPDKFNYANIDSLSLFEGTHPAVMESLVSKEDWKFELDIKEKKFKNFKHKALYFLSKKFGWRPFEYNNYIKI